MLGRGQGLRVGVWPAPRPPVPSSPRLGEALTSAWPPGVSVLLQCSHLRQNLCQSLPRELTFSAGQEGGVSTAPPPHTQPPLPPGPRQPWPLSPVWVGGNQSLEDLNGTKRWRNGEFTVHLTA